MTTAASAALATVVVAVFPITLGAVARYVLVRMHASVGVTGPTVTQEEEEDPESHALFRHVPALRSTLAWRALGDFPTPVHRGACAARQGDAPVATVRFHVKREDLSSPVYGGNKVRTLQHQLAVLEARLERGDARRELVVVGSGGSNQVVATIVHALRMKLKIPTVPLWSGDPPDLDNALNMLSALSLPFGTEFHTWGSNVGLVRALLRKVFGGKSFLLPLGGNNPAGVLGQAGGALELAEQIQAGDTPDCDGIYLAVGSSCTISGLILGVALSRRAGLQAFQKPGFTLRPVLIQDSLAFLHRAGGLYKSKASRFVPLTIRHSLHTTCQQLVALGGPDVLHDALAVLDDETVFYDDKDLVGTYGAHSAPSRTCARLFDKTAVLQDDQGKMAPGLWVCGHFTAKAVAAMCDDLLRPEHAEKNMVLWQTKSCVQPRGTTVDEWELMQNMHPVVRTWAQEGKAESEKRPGKVDLAHGSPEDYRGLMTDVTTL